jgi:hypothetical protein
MLQKAAAEAASDRRGQRLPRRILAGSMKRPLPPVTVITKS